MKKQEKWGFERSIRAIGRISLDDDQSYGMVTPIAFYDYGEEASAEYIVRVLNSHDKLVTALDGLLLGLRMIRGIDLEEYVPQELEQAREALAAAKGE